MSVLTHKPKVEPVRKWTTMFQKMVPMLMDSWKEWQFFTDVGQIALAIPPSVDTSMPYKDQLLHGTGSFHLKNWPYTDKDYTKLLAGFEYIQPILDYAKQQGYTACRPMIRCLHPKTCLSYHADTAEMRFHIPLETSWQAFFVVQDTVHRMTEVGTLYSLQTNVMHTAVNANLLAPRLHFTLSVFKDSK